MIMPAQIDHFLFDFSAPIYECAAYTPLFDPDTLNRHFEVRWHKDPFVLLKWKTANDPDTVIPASVIQRWREQRNKPKHFLRNVCARLKAIYDFNNGAVVGIKIPDKLPEAAAMDPVMLIYNSSKEKP